MLPDITDSGVCDVITNCPQIKSIKLNTRVNITHNTIKQLIKLALNKPNTQFSHWFEDICNEDNVKQNIVFNVIDSKLFNNLLKI